MLLHLISSTLVASPLSSPSPSPSSPPLARFALWPRQALAGQGYYTAAAACTHAHAGPAAAMPPCRSAAHASHPSHPQHRTVQALPRDMHSDAACGTSPNCAWAGGYEVPRPMFGLRTVRTYLHKHTVSSGVCVALRCLMCACMDGWMDECTSTQVGLSSSPVHLNKNLSPSPSPARLSRFSPRRFILLLLP